MAEAANALGRNELTLRSWINKDLVPAPFLYEEARQMVPLYSKGELEVIARELAKHAQDDYQNLCEKHVHVREAIHQYMHAYRAHHV